MILCIGSWLLVIGITWGNASHAIDAQKLVQQGIEEYQAGNYPQAITTWQQALSLAGTPSDSLIIQQNLAKAYGQLNKSDKAIRAWQKTIATAQQLGDNRKLGRLLTEQAQAYLHLGQARQAIAILCGNPELTTCASDSALGLARQNQDKSTETAALGSLGEAYRLGGKYEESIQVLNTALSLSDTPYSSALQQSLGTAYSARAQLWELRAQSAERQGNVFAGSFRQKAESDYQQAENNLKASLTHAPHPTTQQSVLLELIRLGYRSQGLKPIPSAEMKSYLEQSLNLLTQELPGVTSLYATIELALLPALSETTLPTLVQCTSQWQLPLTQRQALLNRAAKLAQTLQDPRAQSFTSGALGHFYECEGNIPAATALTQKAIVAANQGLLTNDSLYLWQWQLARLLKSQGRLSDALTAYQQAFTTLESIRGELLSAERDIQLNFRQSIEPVYREYVQLSLELAESRTSNLVQSQELLSQSLKTIDALRLAELENYLGGDCALRVEPNSLEKKKLSASTAIITSITFAKKTAILLKLPDGSVKSYWIDLNKVGINRNIINFRLGLTSRASRYNLAPAQALYNTLMRPLEQDLEQNQIKTLIFVQDGLLRNIPMSALHDGKKYLIEKYMIATTPSLELTKLDATNYQGSRVLILGMSQESNIDNQNFTSLVNVPKEVNSIAQQFVAPKVIVNEDFKPETLKQELKDADYNLIHIATHAQFGTIGEDTFLVTGNNSKITLNELEKSLRDLKQGGDSVDLIFLAACQTAEEDERSGLGLASATIQAGVKGAIGSLWPVADESTLTLVTSFYKNLVHNGMGKAKALQQAQIDMIHAQENTDINDLYSNPYYWSPFILIGNWL